MLGTLLTAVIAFTATNIDDILILMLFFSDPSFQRRHIVFGQYLGFLTLLLVSLSGFLGSLVIPAHGLGLLGFAPIFIGLRKLFPPASPSEGEAETSTDPALVKAPSLLSSVLNPKAYSVAAITIANGGDNIGIYIPVFANSDLPGLLVIITTFLVLVAALCLAGYRLSRQPHVARLLSKQGHALVPFVLIALGLYIIIESGILTLLHQR